MKSWKLVVKVLIDELAFEKILSKHQITFQTFLSHRDAELLESQEAQKEFRVQAERHKSLVLHCPVADGFNCVFSYLIRFTQFIFRHLLQLIRQREFVIVDWRDALGFIFLELNKI